MTKEASFGLESFVDECMKRARAAGYHATVFSGMRRRHGTIEAIEKLVLSGDIQTGFKKLETLNMLEWSLEQAVLNFPAEFSRNARECADFRLRQVRKP
jgi:hypothetical protein